MKAIKYTIGIIVILTLGFGLGWFFNDMNDFAKGVQEDAKRNAHLYEQSNDSVIIVGQINYQQPPWDLDCDSLETQTEMNICSYQKTLISDSILNDLYEKNLKYYNKLISESKNDSDSLRYNYFKASRDLYKQAQKRFIDYRASLCNLESSEWEGGSIRPLMVNMIFLAITIERIKWVEQEFLENINK